METVLVSEDDPSTLQAFSALLWSGGYKVLEATTGREAIEAETLIRAQSIYWSLT